jgi:hypothetical protein
LFMSEDIMATTKKDESKPDSGAASANRPQSTSGAEYESRSVQQIQEEQQFQVTRAIDQTKENVKRSIEEARREIPQYAQSVTDYHQQVMDSAEEITSNYLDSQRQVIISTQDTWTNYLETVYWWMSPRKMAEMYAQAVSSIADNTVSTSRIWNKSILANMDASKAYFVRAREASGDLSRINMNTARTFERTASQIRRSSSESELQAGERSTRRS